MKTKHRFLALGLHYKLYEQREASVRFFEILLDIIIHKVVSILEEDMLCLGVARMDDFYCYLGNDSRCDFHDDFMTVCACMWKKSASENPDSSLRFHRGFPEIFLSLFEWLINYMYPSLSDPSLSD